MIRRKIVAVTIFIAVILSAVQARPEFWLGGGLRYDMNLISSDWKQYFPAYNEGKISFINSGGLAANFLCFYSEDLRLGLFTSFDLLFPVGFVAESGATEGFISYKFDYRMDFALGAAYYHMLSPKLGLFLEAGMGYRYPALVGVFIVVLGLVCVSIYVKRDRKFTTDYTDLNN